MSTTEYRTHDSGSSSAPVMAAGPSAGRDATPARLAYSPQGSLTRPDEGDLRRANRALMSAEGRDIPRGRHTHDDHELVPDGTELWWCATCDAHVRRRGGRRPAPATTVAR